MSSREKIKLHHIRHNERVVLGVPVGELVPGALFVRSGTPCLVASMPADIAKATPAEEIWITNVLSGGTWTVKRSEIVHPAFDVSLDFRTTRKGGE